jgi:hypothetical protein
MNETTPPVSLRAFTPALTLRVGRGRSRRGGAALAQLPRAEAAPVAWAAGGAMRHGALRR